MRRRSKAHDKGWLFITGATHRRLAIFRRPEFCEIFLENLRFYRRKYGFTVVGYALLPDHYHLLLALPEDERLSDVLRDLKSQIGRQVVDALKKEGNKRWLQRLSLKKLKRSKDSRYCVLQADNHVKRIFSERFLQQKLQYTHANPVRAGLALRTVDYPYSSARWYSEAGAEELTQWRGPLG